MKSRIKSYLKPGIEIKERGNYLECPIDDPSEAIKANAHYFGNHEWAEEYLIYCHRSEAFKSRWTAAIGDWSDKVIVDIGCGPGNIFATLKGKPKLLIGIDVAPTSLELAAELGYLPILADATHLPFKSEFADIVTLNASLHHCEDMEAVLKEAARLVKPGGLLITDHDPQRSAWNYKGIAKLLWIGRLYYYKVIGHGFHKTSDQQLWGLACEIHHKPGHGVTKEMFNDLLKPMGFKVNVFPHNHELGAEVLQGNLGRASFKYRMGNLLSGRNPNADSSALSLMCVAEKM
ncbi:class I SAM-dependent methyltransferase [Pedobacter immunditicola]|uniref:class I SAM-dependent methyltransferase n=1 Tax=Pedobacter immunditicola TaxID=3133440 RepID=UPI0030ABEBE0